MRPVKIGATFLQLAVVVLLGCGEASRNVSETTGNFNVIHPYVVDTTFTKEYIAEINSLQNVEIRTRVKGFIEKIHVDEGKPVREGQILFTLGGREFQENLLKATANYKSLVAELKVAEVELKNTKILAEKNIVSNSELDMAMARKEAVEARIEDAQAAIAIAKLNLSFTQVRAPFTGVINRIPFKTGSLVSEGDLLTTISNNREVFAYFNISEREFIELAKSDDNNTMNEVKLLMANNELFRYPGKVETAENEIDKGTGNIAFRARFSNPDDILKHGASGKILVREVLHDALIIPQKTTFEIQDKIYVYVVDSAGIVSMRNIVPKVRLPHLFVVESGLDVGDRVIYEGIQQLREGEKVNARLIALRDVKFD
jgi:membrane fusion protein (multidrug efflux system)